jgi:PPOX class probable F420-dependent enzyme
LKLYVYTTANAGKTKRIRRDGAIRLAPCTVRGRVTGQWIDARAEIVAGEEFARGMRLLNRKYRPWKQIGDLFARLFSRDPQVVLAIHIDAAR